jgi:thiol-disulfide isomerase/thioredoxin
MATEKSSVTPERFATGFSFKDYIAQITVNKDNFEKFYQTAELTVDDTAFFRRVVALPGGPKKILVIGEDWCPDVFRGMPAMARIAEAAGIEMRIFPRDKNLDIENEFLKEDKYQSIPVCVFYTGDLKYIGHWIERPALANEERLQIETEIKKQMPEANEQQLRAAISEKTRVRYPAWQQATIKEMRKLLEEKLAI